MKEWEKLIKRYFEFSHSRVPHLEDLDKKSGKFKIGTFFHYLPPFFRIYPGCPHSHSSRIGKENLC